MARTADCLLRGHYTTSLSGKTTNALPLVSSTHIMFLPTFSQYLNASMNAASPFSCALPHLESGKFSNSKLYTKMQAADFPTVRFGAGSGSRSHSCDICLHDANIFVRRVRHTHNLPQQLSPQLLHPVGRHAASSATVNYLSIVPRPAQHAPIPPARAYRLRDPQRSSEN
jgi:hypothetical protein